MSEYRVSPEAGPFTEFDPIDHVEAMHARHLVNGRLNEDFQTLAWLRNARFLPEPVDGRTIQRGQVRRFANGFYRYQDVISIARNDEAHVDFPEEFLLEDLGASPIEGLGRLHSIRLNRITAVEPIRRVGMDCLQLTFTADDTRDGSIRRDRLIFALQDTEGPIGSMPQLATQAGYGVWRGELVSEHVRDVNDPATLKDMYSLLDMVSVVTAELAYGPRVLDDLVTPE